MFLDFHETHLITRKVDLSEKVKIILPLSVTTAVKPNHQPSRWIDRSSPNWSRTLDAPVRIRVTPHPTAAVVFLVIFRLPPNKLARFSDQKHGKVFIALVLNRGRTFSQWRFITRRLIGAITKVRVNPSAVFIPSAYSSALCCFPKPVCNSGYRRSFTRQLCGGCLS